MKFLIFCLKIAVIASSFSFGQVVAQNSTIANLELLTAIRQHDGRSEELFSAIIDWNAFPSWAEQEPNLRVDWLQSLHSKVAGDSWPVELRTAAAGTVAGRSEKLAFSTKGIHRAIAIFDTTPVYLAQLVEIINYPFMLPKSADPNATMEIDPDRAIEAINQLGRLLGMLQQTSYLDGPNEIWRPAVIFGTRFIYYHELGHLALGLDDQFPWQFDVYPIETQLAEELYADRFALAMLTLEARSNSDLLVSAMSGVAFAMSLAASQEFVNNESTRSIKNAVLRMGRILYWAQLSVEVGELSTDSVTILEHYWNRFIAMLDQVDDIPSPIYSLLRQTADRPRSDWDFARNQIVKWCVFGDCSNVAVAVNGVCKNAKQQIHLDAAKKTMDVVEYIIKQTDFLEPKLGLAENLRSEQDCIRGVSQIHN